MALVVDLASVSDSDLALVGGKAGKLGELVRHGLPVPPGIVVTTDAYAAFVEATPLRTIIPEALASIDPDRPQSVESAASRIRSAFESEPFPEAMRSELAAAYEKFLHQHAARNPLQFQLFRSGLPRHLK